jgi:hypothetical protein
MAIAVHDVNQLTLVDTDAPADTTEPVPAAIAA